MNYEHLTLLMITKAHYKNKHFKYEAHFLDHNAKEERSVFFGRKDGVLTYGNVDDPLNPNTLDYFIVLGNNIKAYGNKFNIKIMKTEICFQ